MAILTAIFGVRDHVAAGQECARALLIFAYGLALVRAAGRRVFGKWSALDIIVSIVVGSNLSRALTGSAPLVGTMLATSALLVVHWLLGLAAARWAWLSWLVEGRAVDLGRDGTLDHRMVVRHGVSQADLGEALRRAEVESVAETRKLTLEPSGTISVLRKEE